MNPITLGSLATAFAWTGWALGAPSITVLVFYAAYLLRMRLAAAAPAPNFGDNPDALLAILQVFTGALSLLGRFVEVVTRFVFDALALAAGVGLVLAIACWCTSHGLRVHALWGRASASVLLVALLLLFTLIALSVGGFGRVLMVALGGLCVAALLTVWQGEQPLPA